MIEIPKIVWRIILNIPSEFGRLISPIKGCKFEDIRYIMLPGIRDKESKDQRRFVRP
jgi:hypothetical protein